MIFLLPSLSKAFNGQGRGKQNRPDMFLNCLNSISLTADQEKAIAKIREETLNSIKPLTREMRELNLTETILSETINPVDANKIIKETIELKSQICALKLVKYFIQHIKTTLENPHY